MCHPRGPLLPPGAHLPAPWACVQFGVCSPQPPGLLLILLTARRVLLGAAACCEWWAGLQAERAPGRSRAFS